MIDILFKNVGQGDSILIEWTKDSQKHFGIIDCNLYEDYNPMLEEIKNRSIKFIDFIILSHLHFDHYSGFPELLVYCNNQNIKIGYFFHTFETEYHKLLDSLLDTQKKKLVTDRFFEILYDLTSNGLIDTLDSVSNNSKSILLSHNIQLSFLSPSGKDKMEFSKLSTKYTKDLVKVKPDFNNLSTVILIENDKNAVLVTSDAVKNVFKRLTNMINKKIHLVQVPHHGSKNNLHEPFWLSLSKKDKCVAVFSVGDSKKDKLPNIEVVDFFEKNDFLIESTNFVHGIEQYYGTPKQLNTNVLVLNLFSNLVNSSSTSTLIPRTLTGDRSYTFV